MPTTANSQLATRNSGLAYQPESAHLECRMGGSDKVYDVQLSQSENGWRVDCWNGPRGGTLTHQKPKIENGEYAEAKKEFDKIVAAKKKGKDGIFYTLIDSPEYSDEYRVPSTEPPSFSATPAALAPLPANGASFTNSRGAVSAEVKFSPELLIRIDAWEAERFIDDPRYIFQNKEDADRLTVQVQPSPDNGSDIFGYNKSGQIVRLDAQLHAAITRLCQLCHLDRVLLDGEWPTPTGYRAWDVLELHSTLGPEEYDLREYRYGDRLKLLEALFGVLIPAAAYDELSAILHVTETAYTPKTKHAMMSRRYDGDTKVREGVCIKDLNAPYRPGRNGQHKKFKFEQTASFLVGPKPGRKANDGHRSIALYITDPDANEHADWLTTATAYPNRIRFVATAKVADRYDVPPVGSIVEVRYVAAYRTTGGIEQPQLSWEGHDLKVRTDIRPEDCSTAQLKYKAVQP